MEVQRLLIVAMTTPAPGAPGATAPRQSVRARWRDPRLLFGIVLVVTSIVVGVRVVAAFDDSVSYWAVSSDVRTGEAVTRDDLVASEARLSDDGGYLRVDEELPARLDEMRWGTDASAGTLIAHDDWIGPDAHDVVDVPVLALAGSYPHDLASGDVVDVWVHSGGEDPGEATVVLSSVRVASLGDPAESMSGVGRTIVLAVEGEEPAGADLGALAGGEILVIRRP